MTLAAGMGQGRFVEQEASGAGFQRNMSTKLPIKQYKVNYQKSKVNKSTKSKQSIRSQQK
jgi:hypothetical protein